MSTSHLRHCPKHRKPLPCAHCALTAKPINPTWRVGPAVDVDEPPPNVVEVAVKVVALAASKPLPVDPLPVVAKPRRGRPRKHASDAEKQEAYRARKAQEERDKKRRTLISRILKISYGMLPKPYHPQGKSTKVVDQAWASNRLFMRNLRQQLEEMSLADLEEYIETLSSTADHKGRFPGETASGGEPPGAQSRVEAAQAAQATNGSGRVRPKGAGPDSDEVYEHWVPYSEQFPTRDKKEAGLPLKAIEREKLKDIAIETLLSDGRCLVCGLTGLQHLYDAYRNGERQEAFIRDLEEVAESGVVPDSVLASERANLATNAHYAEILRVMRDIRKKMLKGEIEPLPGMETTLGQKLARRGKRMARMHNDEWRKKAERVADQEGWGMQPKARSWS